MSERRMAVLITGATGGIGTAVTETMHSAGWSVGLLDLDHSALETVSAKLNARRPGSATFLAGDAAAEPVVEAWIEQSVAQHDGIAGLVNVAGLWRSKDFSELSFDEIDTVIRANLRTAIVCCRLAAKPMLSAGSGSIVNFASTAGEYGSISPAAHYAAAKGGVIALTKSLARELSPRGVRVNAVSPGPIDTSGLSAGSDAKADEVAARTLLGRLGTPQEIADCVAFLISPKSSFVTGHILRANGGSLL
jgi:NAD(P)-dependent dehydrogenase (short-subunit alcohol dehydrogenase family)